MTIRHISFDVWNTLITANPLYAQERTKIISAVANIPLHQADAAYNDVKRFLDKEAENERCGDVTYAWNTLGEALDLKNHDREQIRLACEAAFMHYAPHLDMKLVDELMKLSENFELSIKSNTNFISGEVLSAAVGFDRMPWWAFLHFSDEMGLCKPDIRFFTETFNHSDLWFLARHQLLHVGDNPICDGVVVDYGMKLLLVNNPQHLLEKLEKGEIINA